MNKLEIYRLADAFTDTGLRPYVHAEAKAYWFRAADVSMHVVERRYRDSERPSALLLRLRDVYLEASCYARYVMQLADDESGQKPLQNEEYAQILLGRDEGFWVKNRVSLEQGHRMLAGMVERAKAARKETQQMMEM